MLDAESPSPLLAGLPFSRETETGRYEVEQLDLLDKRLDVLKGTSILCRERGCVAAWLHGLLTPEASNKTVVFANGARFAANSATLQQPPSTAQLLHRPGAAPIRPSVTRMQVMNLLRGMLASMRDNLGVSFL